MSAAGVLVDSDVILDVVTNDRKWAKWSTAAIQQASDSSVLIINPIIYAEVLLGFADRDELDAVMPASLFERRPVPWDASFLAARIFLRYRRRAGRKSAPLPDFYIGAHSVVEDLTLLTRAPGRYQSHFRELKLIAP